MSVKTIIMNKGQMEQLAKKLQHAEKRKTPPYALYQYKCENCVITAYESGKVVFQGEDADALAELIQPQPIVQNITLNHPDSLLCHIALLCFKWCMPGPNSGQMPS